ncbi:MAG: SDR family NAD(P)-dependent oxidoreductase [candidate division KSB1 bacterium]|nr:SDR family NAD(P)-dependent oxidoreductase [candidate division KSB1 bacterium]
MNKRKKVWQYVKEYKWSNIWAMIRNSFLEPEVCSDDFTGRLVVITGATSGIGKLTAHKYASHGANLLCINRNPVKSEALRTEIETEYGVNCRYLIADLSDLSDIRKAANELLQVKQPIDVLIHNAGVYLTTRELTPDGIEKTLAVHYLSSFIINYLLLDKLKSQKSARIIFVSSEGHRFAAWGLPVDDLNWEKHRYSGLKSYGSAKTAQLLSMIVFAEKCENTAVSINAMHPGAVRTDTGRENGPLYRLFKKTFFDKTLKSAQVSAEALYYLGVSENIKTVNGKFFHLTTEETPAPPALDKDMAGLLWEKSLDLTGLSIPSS